MSIAEAVKTIDGLMPAEVVLWASFSFYVDKNLAYESVIKGIIGQEPELTRFNDETGKTRIKIYAPKGGSRIVVATPYLVEADGLLENAGLVVLDPLFVSCEGYEGCSHTEVIPEELRDKSRYTAPVHFAEKASQRTLVAVDPCCGALDIWIKNYFTELGIIMLTPASSVYGGKSERGFSAIDKRAVQEVADILLNILEKGKS